MVERALQVAIIIGSNRNGRFAPAVGRWFTRLAEDHEGLRPEVIDLGNLDVPSVLGLPDACEPLSAATAVLDRADGFVVLTPEYNHSFPGTLKNFIDLHDSQWRAKPVGFVSYGGRAGGQRAVEHLRQVFAELHAMTIRETVSIHNPWGRFGADGHPDDPKASGAAKAMLDQLVWWGRALRDARAVRPYGT
ncbi:NADPH-dependent FMN reductase [Actinomadura sp. SCN-SB]|uniref:NADPH-dependent FMN reductase n=1 Tax=Actinomadura sp. SCN-SB TaxID=3373092 RepID=UPI003752BFDA